MDVNMVEIAIALGVTIGLLMALTGAGGSIIAIPLLMFGLHLDLLQAAPIALMSVMMAAMLAAIIGLRSGIVRYKAAGLLASTGLLVAPIGVWLAHHVNNRSLSMLFAVVLAYVAVHMLKKAKRELDDPEACLAENQPCKINPAKGKLSWNAPCAKAMMISGTLTGFLSGLLGVGGGFVIVPALRRYTDFDMKTIVATSLTAVAVISLVSVLAYGYKGAIDWKIAQPFVIGTIGGMLIGKAISSNISGIRMQQGFAILALVVASGMLIKAI